MKSFTEQNQAANGLCKLYNHYTASYKRKQERQLVLKFYLR